MEPARNDPASGECGGPIISTFINIYINKYIMAKRKDDLTILKALGDRTRLNAVKILLEGERCACQLPDLLGKAQPTVSLQLKKLVAAGILESRKEGVKCIYRVSDPRVRPLLEALS